MADSLIRYVTSQPFAVPALLFFMAAIPLILGLIPRNRFYGVRTAKTLSEDRVWYQVNRFAAAGLIIASGVYAMVAFFLPFDSMASNNCVIWRIHLAAFAIPVAIGLILSIRYAKRL